MGDKAPLARRWFPLLLLLFVGSGCAALIYEIVWFQLLQMVIGSTAVSLAILLGTFMGGMCIGSMGLARVIPRTRHPLRVYAMLEAGTGVFGLLLVFGMPAMARLYAHIGGEGLGGLLVRGVLCGVLLLPPTVLMGATLPAIARWVETTRTGVSWMGFFYGGNTAGAVLGSLLAGFYLLRIYDMPTATVVAFAVNAVVALVALSLSRVTPGGMVATEAPESAPITTDGKRLVYVAVALSGMSALGAEVIWTRLLSLLLGGTTYTFSIILAVFLAGIGLGSSAGSWLSREVKRPRTALGVCQLLLVAAIAWSAFTLARSLPFWPINPGLASSPWLLFQIDFARCVWAVLPAACLWGASFPLALAAVSRKGEDGARLIGGVYGANTLGAIVGAVAFSLVLIPRIGTQHAQQVLIAIASLAAMIMLRPLALAACAALVAGALAFTVSAVPFELIAYGRQTPWRLNQVNELYRGEGMNSTIAVSELKSNGWRNFHVSGKIEASTEPQDMRLQRLLGNLPALLHPNPSSILVVGFGAGVTAGSFVPYPEMMRMVVVEIEPLIPTVVSTFFGPQNFEVARDPRVRIVYDDARHYVLTTSDKFDLITSDPIHPWVKGAATLYTREYFDLVKAHLNPGGIVTQWVPLYESNEAAVKSEIATFLDVFPHGTVWGNLYNGEGYDVVLLGQEGNARIDLDAIQERMNRPDHALVRRSLAEVNFFSATEVLGTFAAAGADLAPWLRRAEINRDRDLRLQYLAGLTPDSYAGGPIYTQILAHRRFPDNLFVGSDAHMQALRAQLGGIR
ncbi:MAG TPA: fused MFS/spermidine synthase [Gemmatimonadaceae bacterium]|nr:fused MFS/spermidine synthase [Gemmatimonadaceae bacterium]